MNDGPRSVQIPLTVHNHYLEGTKGALTIVLLAFGAVVVGTVSTSH